MGRCTEELEVPIRAYNITNLLNTAPFIAVVKTAFARSICLVSNPNFGLVSNFISLGDRGNPICLAASIRQGYKTSGFRNFTIFNRFPISGAQIIAFTDCVVYISSDVNYNWFNRP